MSLTPAQTAKMPEYVSKWVALGLSTAPCDEAAAEAAVRKAYELAGLVAPQRFVWVDNPVQLFGEAARLLPTNPGVGDKVRDQVWDQVRDQVGDKVGDQVWDQVGDQVLNQVWDQVWDQVGDQVLNQVGGQVGDQVRGQVWDQVRGQVWDQVCFGNQETYLSAVEYYAEVLHVEAAERLRPFFELARHCHWWVPCTTVAVLCRKPTELHLNKQGQLHREDGPAVSYPGLDLYFRNGVAYKSLMEMTIAKHAGKTA